MKYFIVFMLCMIFSVKSICSEFDDIKKLAEQGDADAQFELGLMFDFGADDVQQNYRHAFRWYSAAAEQGEVGAQVAIGTMFSVGKGVEQDFSQAFIWFEKAAKSGSSNAQVGLATLYAEGLGVEKNYVKAYAWYKAAAMQGDEDAINNIRKISKKMTVSQIEQAKKLSSEIQSSIG